MKIWHRIIGGLAGSLTLNLLHELLKDTYCDAPRVDLLGVEVLEKRMEVMHLPRPADNKIYNVALVSDLISNGLYYSLAGGKGAKAKGVLLGLMAGLGAVRIPAKVGLTPGYTNKTRTTQLLTIGIYAIGGLVAGTVINALENEKKTKKSLG